MRPSAPRSLLLFGVGALAAHHANAQTLIADDFEVDTSASYTVVTDGTPDGSSAFAFDYVAAGIPLAPRSTPGDTKGLRLDVNLTAGAVDARTCFHNTAVNAPHYRLRVDVYNYWNTASTVGTTEHTNVGVGGNGMTFNQYASPISGSGAFIAFTGDGGSASDFRWFRASANTPPGDGSSTTLPNSHPSYLGRGSNNTGAFFQSLFPAPPSTFAGVPGNIWTTVEIDVNHVTGLITFYFDDVLTFQGRFAGSLAGLVSLGLADTFTSISGANNAVYFDNLEVFIPAQPGAPCSQSAGSGVIGAGMVACTSAGNTAANQWLRRYSPSTDCGVVENMVVTHVNWGVLQALSPTMQQTVFLRAYSIPTGASLMYSNLTLLSDQAVDVADGPARLLTTALTNPAVVTPGHDLVLEIAAVNPVTPGLAFRPAGNNLGQTAPSYIASAACGLTEPTDLAAIGFPDVHLVLDPVHRPDIGVTICGPAQANSTGNPAHLTALGVFDAAANDVTLHVGQLPLNSAGFFITSNEVNVLPNPAGFGNICIASFTIGRYDSLVQNSGTAGEVSLALDLTTTPQAPGGPVTVLAGETRYWQYWYRDTVASVATSNFSDAVCVTFR